MEVISLGQNYSKPVVMCLGFFDCMHIGHVKLLSEARKIAGNDAHIALFTFSNNHFETLKRCTKLIYTFSERLHLYESLGIDLVVSACFDETFMSETSEQFLRRISQYKLAGIVCGKDFTCGSDLATAENVREFFRGVAPVEIVELVLRDENKVCSSAVRQLLEEGEIQRANILLSQPFFFLGTVQRGRHVGHELGFPTVNLEIPTEKIVPSGVYCGTCEFEGQRYKALVNVGAQPTFGCVKGVVEAHLLNFKGDLYGKKVKISLEKFLREIRKFASAEELKAQLARDLRSIL